MAQVLCLLYPKFIGFKNRIQSGGGSFLVKVLLLLVFGLLFWSGIFVVLYRVLVYFRGIEVFGDILAAKLLSMVLLTFFSILIFSNVITAISTFFISEELQLIIASPFHLSELYFSKCFETVFSSSWMVLLFSLPVFIAYGIVYRPSIIYFLVIPLAMAPFFIVCGSLGIVMAISLVKIFPAKRVKDILLLLSIFLIIALYFLFRFLQPEKLVDPETFYTVIDYFTALKAPTSPFLPSQWATDLLASFLFPGDKAVIFNLLLLWSTAMALIVMVNWLFEKIYYDAWSKSQEAKSAKMTKHRFFDKILQFTLAPLAPATRSILTKDIRLFFRDTAQWSQIFILAAIIVIYLYNFSVLPMEKSPFPTIYLQNLIAFLNLGLAGFALSAVAVRFSFPAISMEGESFWIIRSSPLQLKNFIWCKFWLNFWFLVILAEMLIVCSNYLLQVSGFMMILSAVTIAMMTFGITSLSIGCGAIFPRFTFENIAQIPTGFGGLLYMIFAILLIGSIVVLEAWPVYLILMAKFTGRQLTSIQWVEIGISFGVVAVINCLAFWLPMRVGLKKLSTYEKF